MSLIDYAHPMMMAEKHQKQAHNAFLEGDWVKGKEELLHAIAELRIACMAAQHLHEQTNKKAN